MPGPMKEYKNLTNGEHMVKIEKELSKGIDPCEKGMECKQDREIRKPEEKEEETEEKELNWKHEDLVPEAPDPISIPDTNSIPKPQNPVREIIFYILVSQNFLVCETVRGIYKRYSSCSMIYADSLSR